MVDALIFPLVVRQPQGRLFLSPLYIDPILFSKRAGIYESRNYGQIYMGKQWEMVRRVVFFPLRLNNFRVLDPDGRGDKDIVKFKPEKIFAEPVKGSNISQIGISCPKGVY